MMRRANELMMALTHVSVLVNGQVPIVLPVSASSSNRQEIDRHCSTVP